MGSTQGLLEDLTDVDFKLAAVNVLVVLLTPVKNSINEYFT
jgi:hypothetical protein